MTFNIIEDYLKLHNVSSYKYEDIQLILCKLILQYFKEANLNYDNFVDIDIGFGTVCLKNEPNGVIFRFIPSDNLKNHLKDNKNSDFIKLLENKINMKMLNTYKDFM